ncbi:putative 2-phosphosulfolactate phosphatase [Rubripirellula amarantea]|uniref:Probable 2-phosphosulfolactate phosphatase n=1 Tax=Rubripirellula amarantea TaxID=2527999 RepID=A0A5C5WSD7_9BACT|nr:2-phosphosulfolactate phosphatase [Rubripirellula amarantea]TWT53003.1 putative 2-phosphosulfolactate phosphatase [Rubripirellula amarantea]
MKLYTSLSPGSRLDVERVDVALVIDVLRATTVMTTALAKGASEIVTCLTVNEAVKLAARDRKNTLLCGERACQKIDGFDLGNSPAEYSSDRVDGKTLVLTTTNGTRAIATAALARAVYAVSFLNLTRTAQHIRNQKSVLLVCAGTDGYLTGEDVWLAGAIADRLTNLNPSVESCDSTAIVINAWRNRFGHRETTDSIARTFRETRGGRNLIRLGFEDDLVRCAAIDSLPILVQRVSREPSRFTSGG